MRSIRRRARAARRRACPLQRRRRSTWRRGSSCPSRRRGSPFSRTPATPWSARGGCGSRSTAAPPAPPFLPAHAHADALSLQLWWDGRPGGRRHGHLDLRAGRRARPGPLDGRPLDRGARRGQPVRALACVSHRAAAEVRLDVAEEGGLEASVVWPSGATHVRRVEWSEDEVVVSTGSRARAATGSTSRLVLAPGERVAAIEPWAAGGRRAGWVSERFGERTGTDVLCISHSRGAAGRARVADPSRSPGAALDDSRLAQPIGVLRDAASMSGS